MFRSSRSTSNFEGSPNDRLLAAKYKRVRGLMEETRACYHILEGSSCVDSLPPENEVEVFNNFNIILQSYFTFSLCQPLVAS